MEPLPGQSTPLETTERMQAAPVVPAMPPMASNSSGGIKVLMGLRRNALSAFPNRCLDEPVVRLRMVTGHLAIASAPEAIGHVMITQAQDYIRVPFGRRVLGPLVGRGLLVSEGEPWRQQRRAMAPAFTPRNLPILTQHIVRCVEASCARLAASAGRPIDLLDEMQELSLEIASTSLFSLEADRFGADLRDLVTEYMRTIGRLYPTDVFLPDAIPTPVRMKRANFRRRWRKLVSSVIALRRRTKSPDQPRDLFDLLSQACGPENEDLLIDEVSTMLVAGHETTALTLFWACMLLAQAPDWQERLAVESSQADLSVSGATASLDQLVLCRAVVQETLRLYSPAFMAARIANVSHEVCGVRIPKGSLVLLPYWLVHRNARWWPRPVEFDPTRFMGNEPARFTYLPFGVGRHVCIGAQLAMAESTLAMAGLMRRFKLTRVDDRIVLPVARITTRPQISPRFIVQPR